MAQKYVNLNLNPLRKYRAGLRRELESGGRADDLLTTWGRRYLAYLRDRFRLNRSGGGSWPPLAASTLAERKSRIGILHVKGAVFNALRPGQPGNLMRRVQFGIRVGVGGPAKHPDSDLTIAQMVLIHNGGTETIPRRQIIYQPDRILQQLMRRDAKRTMRRLAREAGAK